MSDPSPHDAPQDDTLSLGDLVFDPQQARTHTPRGIGVIESSLQRNGAARSIVIDESNRILAGNGTVEAAMQAGFERVRIIEAEGDEIIAVRRSNLTEAQKLDLAITDNRAAELSGWDAAKLVELFSEDPDLAVGRFTDQELAALASAASQQNEERDPLDGMALTENPTLMYRVVVDTLSYTDARELAASVPGAKVEQYRVKFDR